MKKVILLLILVLPVIIVALSMAISGYIAPIVKIVRIEGVKINLDGFYNEGYSFNDTDKYDLIADTGVEYELEKFLSPVPASANLSSLEYVSTNPSAASVVNGKIKVEQNMRSSDYNNGGVIIDIIYDDPGKPFFTIAVNINVDPDSFDYLGFDYNRLAQGIPGSEWSGYCEVTPGSGYLSIYRDKIGGTEIPLGRILRNGLDTAPYNILNADNPFRPGFINSLDFSSDNPEIVIIPKGQEGGLNVTDAGVLSAGKITVKIKADFLDRLHEISVNIEIF